MKILMINVVCGIRSTGRICADLAIALEAQGHDVKIAYGRETVPEPFLNNAVRIGTDLDVKLHGIKARLFDACGFGSKKATIKFIEWVKKFDPDVIHLHNIHGYYINVEVLFDYLRTCGKKILWTLHDCWAFTGHAAYCEYSKCDRWREGCFHCPNIKEYPASLTDRSKANWRKKKEIMNRVPNLTIVTPSVWLSELVKKSFLSQYQVVVVHNCVDTSVFYPRISNIDERLGTRDKKIVLGVAALWEKRKGLEDFIKLSHVLSSDYQIVLVGLSKEQSKKMPRNIICVERTDSIQTLAELYSAAKVYLNLTYEDNYPTTNLEAIACGTPVITYKTGGSGESAVLFGRIIEKGNLNRVLESIQTINEVKNSNPDIGIRRFVQEYLNLY